MDDRDQSLGRLNVCHMFIIGHVISAPSSCIVHILNARFHEIQPERQRSQRVFGRQRWPHARRNIKGHNK